MKEALQARVDDFQTTAADLRRRLDYAEEEKLRLLPPPNAGQEVPVPCGADGALFLGQGDLRDRLGIIISDPRLIQAFF